MKTALAIVMSLGLTVVAGCELSGSKGGVVTKDEGFKIAVPQFETNLKQGELQTVTVTIKRDDYFKQDVKLDLNTTAGVTVDPTSVRVRANDKPDVQVRLSANKDSALGDYRVSVNGTPETGEPTSAVFKVKVVAP
jgi:uncharacterized membrane protein